MNRQIANQTQQKFQIATPVSSGILQRKCACGNQTRVGGECEECKKNRLGLQRKRDDRSKASEVPPIEHDVLRSSGQPLDTETRAFFEPHFGQDFSHVRVHTDARAGESAKALGAFAYTIGRDIVFDAGQYAPASPEGRGLLAHELTHVVQQGGANVSLQEKLTIGAEDSAYEKQADQMAANVILHSLSDKMPRQDGWPLSLNPIRLADCGSGRPRMIQTSRKGAGIGVAIGGGVGLVAGALIGGLLGGLPGALIGGLISGLAGAGIGALLGWLFTGKKIKVDNSCKGFCSGLDIAKEAEKADGKTTDKCKDVSFNYQVQGQAGTKTFNSKIDFGGIVIKCNSADPNCGGWSSKGVITLGKAACNSATCGPLASTILHEMVHDWAGWGPPFDKNNVTVPGASHTSSDYLDEWVARYVEKSCFMTDPWGLP